MDRDSTAQPPGGTESILFESLKMRLCGIIVVCCKLGAGGERGRNGKIMKETKPTSDQDHWPQKAYKNLAFLTSSDARPIRVLCEFTEPNRRFESEGPAEQIPQAKRDLGMSRYYEDARQLAYRLTEWAKTVPNSHNRFGICSGGGPGIMEAANRGASEAGGPSIGFNISLPYEQQPNPYQTRELSFEFHYFFIRKFWFVYLARAMVVFPGGFGTMDEFFEVLTLLQTHKTGKKMPIVVYGTEYWKSLVNFDAMVDAGMIDAADLELFHFFDDVDGAFEFLRDTLTRNHLLDEQSTGK